MEQENKTFITISLGSSYIRGMAATKLKNNIISPIHVCREPAGNAIRYGRIHNLNDLENILDKIRCELQAKIDSLGNITGFYIGLEARSMRSETVTASIDLGAEGTVVEEEHLRELRRIVGEKNYEGYEKIKILDPRYYTDNSYETNPKGIRCSRLKAKYQVVLIDTQTMLNLREVVEERLGLNIVGVQITPLAEAFISLDREDQTLGCAFVDIGSQTTSISIFKERHLSALRVFPMGGRNVTKDLMNYFHLIESDAERLKLNHATLNAKVNPEELVTVGNRSYKLQDVNNIVRSRMMEISLNIFKYIEHFIQEENQTLSSGIIFTGGATLQSGYLETVEELGMEGIRLANIRTEFIDESERKFFTEENLSVIGLTALAKDSCVEMRPDLAHIADEPLPALKPVIEEETIDQVGEDIIFSHEEEEDYNEEFDEREEPDDTNSRRTMSWFKKATRKFTTAVTELINGSEDD